MSIVALTGFMGTGKSTLGRALAAKLGCPFVDSDVEIEKRLGCSIAQVFAEQGEEYFRRVERQVLGELVQRDVVLATGGGAIVDERNYSVLHAAGPIVCLRAEVSEILRRTGRDRSRPLLQGEDREARVRALLAQRESAYARADLMLETTGVPVAQLVEVVLEFLRRRAGGDVVSKVDDGTVLTVELGERSYPIRVGSGTLDGIGAAMRQYCPARRAHVVTNPTVAALFGARVRNSLTAQGFDVTMIEIPDGEEHKRVETLASIYDAILATKPERSWPVVALGGGVVGDMAGFAAATVLRGVPFVQIPTTLLAQVDSSVGGKTGINHAQGKNLIGAFYQPTLVWIDLQTLASLPRRELLAGFAEVAKYGVILDAELFSQLEENLDAVLRLDPQRMAQVVLRSCALKARVVGEDERETGLRAILNFGHTLGHAVETLTGYSRFLHGEAVAIGMAFAARLSHRLGQATSTEAERVVTLLQRAGLPVVVPPELGTEALATAISGDKKSSGGRVKFVLMDGLGKTTFASLSAEELAAHVDALRH